MIYLIRCHVNPQLWSQACVCRYCKSNRVWCTLMNLSKFNRLDYVSRYKYTTYIPKWLLNEMKLNTKRRWHKIDDFAFTQNNHYIPQNKMNSILFGNHVSFVAFWISPELQSISPLFNPSKSTQKINPPHSDTFKLYTRNEWMKILKLKQYNQVHKHHLQSIAESLGWSEIRKSKNYLSSIVDLKYHHLQLLKQILYKGKQFVSRLSGIHPDHVYCFVHFSNKLHLYEMYRLYVTKRSKFLENIIECLESSGNIDGILGPVYMCKHMK